MSKWIHRLTEVNETSKTAICANCGPVQIYHQNKGGGRFQWHCIEKRRAQSKKWSQSEKGKAYLSNYQKQWEPLNKDRRSAINRKQLLKHHGLSLEDFDRMVAERDGRCDICKEKKEKLCVDHCHATLVIRGLLCHGCNLVLGYAKDRPLVLSNAASYLTNPNLIKKE